VRFVEGCENRADVRRHAPPTFKGHAHVTSPPVGSNKSLGGSEISYLTGLFVVIKRPRIAAYSPIQSSE
jgi:hypothetical protein